MRGSTALKERLAASGGEQAFERVRKEHDRLVAEIVARGGAGEVIKSTGDGVLALFEKPSVAVERALEIQDRLREHPHVSVRIGLDCGEVKLETVNGQVADVFGRHVDWAWRAMELARDGRVCVTRGVYTDAASWIGDRDIAWKAHGSYRVKPGDPALEVYEPYRPGVTRPSRALRGQKVADVRGAPVRARAGRDGMGDVAVVRPWEAVARDGRDFARKGAGAMYWFRVPLGGISYPEGFRSFLQPALENPRITKIRFVLDGSQETIRDVWQHLVLRLLSEWAEENGRELQMRESADRGSVVIDRSPRRTLAWIFVDLSREFTPCFKLLVHDLESEDEVTESGAQIFLSTAQRTVWLHDGTQRTIRIPDAILRVRSAEHEALLHALNGVANQWDSLFPA
jgi:class 3 adenylate cyclase